MVEVRAISGVADQQHMGLSEDSRLEKVARRRTASAGRRALLRLATVVLVAAALPLAAHAQVAIDAAGPSAAAELTRAANTLNFTHTTTGTNLVLVVGVSMNISQKTTTTVSGVTYNGAALTLAGAQNSGNNGTRTEIWYRIAPATGTNLPIVVTLNVGAGGNPTIGTVAGAVTFTGADQTTPVRTFASNLDAGASGFAYVNVTSSTDDVVFENLALASGTTVTSTPGVQTQQWATASTGGIRDAYGFASTRAGAPSVPMNETLSRNARWADAAVSIQPSQADLSVTAAGSATLYPNNLTYTVTVTNNGPSAASAVSLTDTLPSGVTLVSAVASGTGSCTGANCTWASLAVGANVTATITVVPTTPGGYPLSSSVSATTPDLVSANNSTTSVSYSEIDQCTTGVLANNTTITGTINTYYPGTATATSGSTTITLGAANGGHALVVNDEVLIIQMQDAAINPANNTTYGDGVSGSGSTNLNNAGVYEYATVVSFASPTLTVHAAGPGGGLLYTYTTAAASAAQGARRFQVVYVPKFNNGTLSGNLTATAWNGSSGGVIALDIAGILTLGGRTISVDGDGFRGAPGLWQSGSAGTANTDYLFTAPAAYNTGTLTQVAGADGSKGEGIAGTPEWIENSTATAGVVTGGAVASSGQTYAEGYPLGSMARGAPGNAGGGATDGDPVANDQNAGGGGGANGGSGGQGGDSWNSNLSVGGLGGSAFPSGISRVVMGGGGGAGSSNNNNDCTGCNFVSSSGAPGGGIVMIRANQITGNATITANGLSAFNTTPQDGGGGAGAAGSIVFLWNSVSAGASTIALTANGGRGGDAWDADAGGNGCGGGCGGGGLFADRHGPGGGGGGGVIIYSGSANATVTPTATGGTSGITLATANLFYGATGGGNGTSTSGVAITSSPGPHTAAACTDLSVTKTASPNPVIVNNPLAFTITVANTTTTASPVSLVDNLPPQVTYVGYTLSCTPNTFACSSGLCSEDPSTGVLQCAWPSIAAGQSSTITVNTTAATPYSLATNTAIVNSTGIADSNPANNTATVNVPIEGPTAVRLNSFVAAPSGGSVVLSWASGGELRNLGFNVYREVGGQRVLLNQSLIAGSALLMRAALPQHGARSYGWIDPSPVAGAIYWLEDVDLNGTRTMHGPVSAQTLPSLPSARLGQNKSLAQTQTMPRAMTLRDMAVASTSRTSLPVTHFREALAQPRVSASTQNVGFQLAAQPAVEIQVDHEGWYQVTQPQLVAAGLPPNLPSSSLRLFAEGVEQPISVVGTGAQFGPQSSIEFYGTAIDTPYSGQRVYWLSWNSGPGLRIANAPTAGTAGPAQPSFLQTVELKPRITYFAALLSENTDNFFGPLVSPTPADMNLNIQNSAPGQGTMEVSLQGVTKNQQHTVTVSLNGAVLGEMSFFDQQLAKADFEIPSGVVVDGANTISLTAQSGTNDLSLVDYVDVSFPHTFTAESDFLKFTAQSGQSVTIDGFAAPPAYLIDVTNPNNPTMLPFQTNLAGTYALTATVPWTASSQHTLLALSSQSLAVAAGFASHAPSALHAQQAGANVVMLTAPQFVAEMQPLASFHRSQGNSVALLTVNQVYDEFNFGEPTPYAIKTFLQTAEGAWHNQPRYLLLGGDASLDPRNYLGTGFFDFVPTKIIVTSELKTASDDWFSDFNNTGFATIATGRMPGRTTTDMQTMVSKTLSYFGNSNASWANNAMMVADVGDPSVDFSQESLAVQKLLPSTLNVTDLFVSAVGAATVRQGILSGIQSGQSLVDYNGHGSVEIWAGSDLFDDTAASTLTNGNRLPLFVMMNCLNGFFQDVFTQSLASALLLSPNGGGVAVWASSGLSAPDPQFQMNQALMRNLFAGRPVALGDAVLLAKQGIADPDARRTFILFGDPLLRIKQPAGAAAH